jgi:hypothetical protein
MVKRYEGDLEFDVASKISRRFEEPWLFLLQTHFPDEISAYRHNMGTVLSLAKMPAMMLFWTTFFERCGIKARQRFNVCPRPVSR